MNRVFQELTYHNLYRRCIMASVAHAIMVGEYELLAAEQSWDGANYSFQNTEGVRGTISFGEECYVCVVQASADCAEFEDSHISRLFWGARKEIVKMAQEEALQYTLIEYRGKAVPFISAAFWGDQDGNFSNQSELELINHSERAILPFLFDEKDALEYWRDYYEMNDAQIKMMIDIYERRIHTDGKMYLTAEERTQLEKWFDNMSECMESFRELSIL